MRKVQLLLSEEAGGVGVGLEDRMQIDDRNLQLLLGRQAEIDSVLSSWVDTEMRARATSSFAAGLNRKRSVLDGVRNFVTLQGVRRLLGLTAQPTPPVLACDVPLLREILQEAKATVNSLGGTLYFVYLPSWARYHTREY